MAYFFALLAGTLVVLQSGMNKNISQQWGFAATVLIGAIGYLVFNLIFLSLTYYRPQWFPAEYLPKGSFSDFRWYWVLPGLFGFSLVMGITVSISQIGAVSAILLSIASQVVTSMLWDKFIDDRPLGAMKIAGAVIACIGVFMTTR